MLRRTFRLALLAAALFALVASPAVADEATLGSDSFANSMVMATVAPVSPTVPTPVLHLQVSAPEKAVNGEVIELSGRVVDAGGVGVAGAGISVLDDSGEVSDSYTVTDAGGRFTTWYSVPGEQGDGELRLTLVAEGAGTDKVTIAIPVLHTDVATEDPATLPPGPATSPTPSSDTTEAAAAPPEPRQSTTPSASTAPLPDAQSSDGALSWILVTVVTVAAIAVACLGLLIVRSRRGHLHRGTSELTFFHDERDAPAAQPETGPEPGAQPASPRRALPD